jgi:hypothetical protein
LIRKTAADQKPDATKATILGQNEAEGEGGKKTLTERLVNEYF